MSWITSIVDIFRPRYLDWDEYKQKILDIETKKWKEQLDEENRRNITYSS